MTWNPRTFDEACKRAAGRRAYNKDRRLARAQRISRILYMQDTTEATGRELAALLGVHESTICRDLRFIKRLRAEFQKMCKKISGVHIGEMHAESFKWINEARAYELCFEIRNGVRVR